MYEAIPTEIANNSYKAMRTVTVQKLGNWMLIDDYLDEYRDDSMNIKMIR
jgi:hypothetical protein